MSRTILYAILWLGLIQSYQVKSDPCIDNVRLTDLERRRTNYQVDTANGEERVCDRYLLSTTGKWYNVDKLDMPTFAPTFQVCGTTFPIWLSGTIPTIDDGEVDRTACMVGPGGACHAQYPIKIKACPGDYRVYFLAAVNECDVAYCFGEGILDTPPTFQPTNVSVKPDIIQEDNKLSQLKFICQFNKDTGEDKLFYQIRWYIDEQGVHTVTVHHDNLETEGFLYEQEGQFTKVGVNVECRVRAKNQENGVPGPTGKSDKFFAGFKLSKTHIELTNGNESSFIIEPTVPFRCFIETNCKFTLNMVLPNNDTSCTQELALNAKHCRKEIPVTEFHAPTEIKFKVLDDDDVVFKGSVFSLNIVTATSLYNKAWHDYHLPTIKVHVQKPVDETYKSVVCYSRNDPHMKTFDGETYENQRIGTFILYDHIGEEGKVMQVQVKHTPCGSRPGIFCNCGVAIRAGGDLFKIDGCNGHLVMEYVKCGDSILRAYKYSTSINRYNVLFPTGTQVEIELFNPLLNVRINPSVHDFKSSRGLCGFFSNTDADDFLKSNGVTTQDSQDFGISWRVDNAQERDLFSLKYTDDLPLWSNMEEYCTCPKQSDGTNKQEIQCSPGSTVECSRETEFKRIGRVCMFPSKRRRRSVEYPWKSVEKRKKRNAVDKSLYSSEVPPNNVTETEARAYCESFMESSSAYTACKEVPNVSTDDALNICILDYQLTGTTSWSVQTLETMKGSCFDRVRRNSTLWENPDDGSPSIAASVRKTLCPGTPECSGHGSCNDGSCVCNDGFGSTDCSVDLSVPPELFGLRGEGLCNSDEVLCNTAYVIGPEMYDSKNLTCKLRKFELTRNGSRSYLESSDVPGSHETLAEIHCPIPEIMTSDNGFVHGFTLSVSYDAITFSEEELDYFVYDETCQSVNDASDSPTFNLKDSYCFIEGLCVAEGVQKPNQQCQKCDPKVSSTSWSKHYDTQECLPRNPPDFSKDLSSENRAVILILGVCAGLAVTLR